MNAIRSRLSARVVLLGAGALGFATLATFGANRYIANAIETQRAQSRPAAPATSKVVVAKYDLVAGEVVSTDNMAVRDLPVEFLPGSVLRPERFESVSGMRISRAMRSGEPLLQEALQPADPGGLSTRVRQGIRALTLSVDEINSVSGMLRPGDRIDLLLTVRPPGADSNATAELTKPLLQDLLVLATGRKLGPASEEAQGTRPFTTITVEIGPEEAKRVVIAQRAGKITALLRHPDDRRPMSESAVDVGTLLGVARSTPTALRPAPSRSAPELIVGGMGSLGGNAGRRMVAIDDSAAQSTPPPGTPVAAAPSGTPSGSLQAAATGAPPARPGLQSPLSSPQPLHPPQGWPQGAGTPPAAGAVLTESNQPRLFR